MKKIYNKGFSLLEVMVVMVVLGCLISIAVPRYNGYLERVTQQVCNANCIQLERMYHVYLLVENKEDTDYVFDEFLQTYEGNLCPANGDIKYVHGIVRCILHFEDEANEGDEDNGSVPFL
ncbi:MAG: prepilin-type N-terminal cleavage/methylation domain-containing protein [Desulfitobacteriaceae bacterium]|nr:prepilin-type N-terminal cleavage/methylation domain-containing protein [Desulfitobacteriaceae bacterium]MDD4347408.1 prepilin-type N-terminal cleavage/methylation domain-containing protein [Desulfitobacteriaceae bacterium]MDD4401860.1 prepilin-type N-terminal cleavage/methylation domain-containing protein [Desulfitobacteriaceae bacterium]